MSDAISKIEALRILESIEDRLDTLDDYIQKCRRGLEKDKVPTGEVLKEIDRRLGSVVECLGAV